MYLLVHHLDSALAGSPRTELTEEKPLLHSTLTWQVREGQRARVQSITHILSCNAPSLLNCKVV